MKIVCHYHFAIFFGIMDIHEFIHLFCRSKKSVKKKSRGKETKKQSKRKKVPDKKKESTGKRSEQHSPTKSSKGGEEKPTPIVDKFGFYHSQQLAPSSSSAAHEGASKQGSDPKRSTSADRRQPVNSLSTKKRKRRSSGSPPPPRKRKTSPSKSKQSYIAATSRSGTGSLGKGGDRDLRERRTASRKKPSLSPQRSSRRKAKGQKKAQLTGANRYMMHIFFSKLSGIHIQACD